MAVNTNNTNNPKAVSGSNAINPTELYHQFVFTHCRQDESCNGEAGFQIRLRSCDSKQMEEFTARLSYEPLDTQMQDPEASPHRLAWLKYPGDGNDTHCVFAHSRYLGRDTEGRWGNFFTRTIFFPLPLPRRLSLKRVLQCCDSPIWNDLNFGNRGIEFSAEFAGIPDKGSTIDDHELQTFLSDEHFPGRAGTITPRHRQQLLAWTVTACLTALSSSPVQHVYIHGEPWLVAMLLYGAATVLPEKIMEDLTFSTYEKPGQLLRSFRSANVIGTITDHPEHGLHDDFLERQGLIIDTFTHRYSDASEQRSFKAIERYISLVTGGKLESLSHLHALAALDSQSMNQTPGNNLDAAWQILAVQRKLSTRRQALTDDDIVATLTQLQSIRLGQIVLSEQTLKGKQLDIGLRLQRDIRNLLWTVMREQCIRLPGLHTGFERILTQKAAREQHLRELATLLSSNSSSWEQSWQHYRHLDRQGTIDTFEKLLIDIVSESAGRGDAKSIDLKIRIEVLREYDRLSPGGGPLPQKLEWLLRLQCVDEIWEFDELRATAARLPEEWIGQAMAVSMSEDTKAAIVPLLLLRKEEANNDYSLWWSGFSSTYHAEPSSETRKQKLRWIFSSEPDEVINLFFMLKHRLKFEDSDLEEPFLRPLVDTYWQKMQARQLGNYGWMHHWSDINKVVTFLPYFRENEISVKIWNTIFESIGLGLLCEKKDQIISKKTINEWLKKRPSAFPKKTRDQLSVINDKYAILSSEQQAKKRDERAKLHSKLNFTSGVLLVAYAAVCLLSIWGDTIVTYIKVQLSPVAGWLGL